MDKDSNIAVSAISVKKKSVINFSSSKFDIELDRMLNLTS